MPLRFDPMYVQEAFTPTPINWLVPGLLPRGQVVLLDGPSGVGKTRFAAALVAHATRGLLAGHPEPMPVLWLSFMESFEELTFPHLYEHQFQERLFRANHGPRNEEGKQLDLNFAIPEQFEGFMRFLAGFRNQLVVIDEPDELFLSYKADHNNPHHFWYVLHHFAKDSGNCILVMRRPANGMSKQSRSLYQMGDQLSILSLSLAWHPHERSQRLLTVTKNKRGPTGSQHLVTIDGPVTWTELHDDDHAKPHLNTNPTTWVKKKPGPVSQAAKVIKELVVLLTEPQPAKQIQERLMSQGYPLNSIRTAVHHLGIRSEKRGAQWWYISSQETLTRSQEFSPLAPLGRGAGGEGTMCKDESAATATLISRTSTLKVEKPVAKLSPLAPPGRGAGGEGASCNDESATTHISPSSKLEDANFEETEASSQEPECRTNNSTSSNVEVASVLTAKP